MNIVDEKTEMIPLFSMPLYKSFIEPLKEPMVEALKNLEYNKLPAVINQPNMDQYGLVTDSKTLHKTPRFSFLKQLIDQKVNHFAKQILQVSNFDFEMHTMWAVKHEPGHWAFKHSHKNSLISGVLYIDVHPNCGNIIFEKPLHYLNLFPSCFIAHHTQQTIFNSGAFCLEPQNNMIILFPSHLEHYVMPNESGFDRYCIAFDYFMKGEIRA